MASSPTRPAGSRRTRGGGVSIADVAVNTRPLLAPLTGIQRYTREVVGRLDAEVATIAPSRAARGWRGHVWEQTVLPFRVGGRLLFSPGGTGPWRFVRQVVTIHDAAPLDHPEWFHPAFARWYRFVQPRLLRHARSVITVSEFSRERLAVHVPAAADALEVIPLAAGPEFRPAPPEEVDAVLARLSVARPYVLVVGSLQPRKNLAGLLAAWERLGTRVLDATLVVAGARFDAVFARLRLERRPENVRFVDYVPNDDLPALYTGAAAFVYPSLYEGFGLPPLEAMACGAPVVVADAGALPEVTGDASVLVDPLDPDSIAGGILRVLDDAALRDRLRDAALARAQQFSWERTAAATRDVLLRALAEDG